jgi:hypothetical protein
MIVLVIIVIINMAAIANNFVAVIIIVTILIVSSDIIVIVVVAAIVIKQIKLHVSCPLFARFLVGLPGCGFLFLLVAAFTRFFFVTVPSASLKSKPGFAFNFFLAAARFSCAAVTKPAHILPFFLLLLLF